jgi:hypothetical protein
VRAFLLAGEELSQRESLVDRETCAERISTLPRGRMKKQHWLRALHSALDVYKSARNIGIDQQDAREMASHLVYFF